MGKSKGLSITGMGSIEMIRRGKWRVRVSLGKDPVTAWSSSNVGYTYMRIDRAGQTGYLTAS